MKQDLNSLATTENGNSAFNVVLAEKDLNSSNIVKLDEEFSFYFSPRRGLRADDILSIHLFVDDCEVKSGKNISVENIVVDNYPGAEFLPRVRVSRLITFDSPDSDLAMPIRRHSSRASKILSDSVCSHRTRTAILTSLILKFKDGSERKIKFSVQ